MDLFGLNIPRLLCCEPKGEKENFSDVGDTGGDANGSRRLRKSDTSGDPVPREAWEGEGEGVMRGCKDVRLNSGLGEGRTFTRARQMISQKRTRKKSLR